MSKLPLPFPQPKHRRQPDVKVNALMTVTQRETRISQQLLPASIVPSSLCWQGELSAWGVGIWSLKSELGQREVQEAPCETWAPGSEVEGAWASSWSLLRHS